MSPFTLPEDVGVPALLAPAQPRGMHSFDCRRDVSACGRYAVRRL